MAILTGFPPVVTIPCTVTIPTTSGTTTITVPTTVTNGYTSVTVPSSYATSRATYQAVNYSESCTESGVSMSSNYYAPKESKEIKLSKYGFKAGDWVRVIRNDMGSPNPHNDGYSLLPYDAVKVIKIDSKTTSSGRSIEETVVYSCGRTSSYLPSRDVEKIENCICARPVVKAAGCKCGYQTMLDAPAKEVAKKAAKLAPPPWEVATDNFDFFMEPWEDANEPAPPATPNVQVW